VNTNTWAYEDYEEQTGDVVLLSRPLLMLYDGAIKNLAKAQMAINNNDYSQAHVQIIVAQDIIFELMAVLSTEEQTSRELSDLYNYLYNQIAEANIMKDCAIINELEKLMLNKRNVWQKATREKGIEDDGVDSIKNLPRTG
jgi:flagellar protein FliS